MVIDEARKAEIKEVFRAIHEYKEMNKENNRSAGEILTRLVASMSTDKAEQQLIKKSLKKAYREYEDEQNNEPDTLEDALTVISVVCKGSRGVE